MSRQCYICGKKPGVGHKVSHSNRKSKRLWKPNLQTVHIKVGQAIKKVTVCTKCLKKGKIKKAI
ncbi:MAG: 50S ribosomal protein L28 [Candidatus Margulisiibacteriota bacterium]